MLMHLDDVSEFRAFVTRHAGEQHPLSLWLADAEQASNKTLERARAT